MKKFYIYILLAVLSISYTYGQNKDTKKADQLFSRLEYKEAIDAYTGLIEKGKADTYVYEQLAKSYAILNDSKKAASFFKRAVKNKKDVSPSTMLTYAETLKANGDEKGYTTWMKKFAKVAPNDSRAIAFLETPNYLENLKNREPLYTVTNAGSLNSKYADFGGYVKDNTLYFSSSRNMSRKNHKLNGEPFLDIYTATTDGSSMGKPEILEGDVNTRFHESTIAISPDGMKMYFDRNDYFEGDYDKSEEGINQINLYTAEKVAGRWENITSAPFNDDNFSTGHPALSPDGKTLYFTSDKPGGKGQSDLYMVAINDNGTFGEPQRLDDTINTTGSEVFPFVDANGTLYFSSNGHLGLGGLDVFSASAKANSFQSPSNMGPGVNSTSDDFAISIDPVKETGYVSSNRDGGKGSDDIYILGQVPPCDVDVAINVEDESGNGISKALVTIQNDSENTSDSDTATTTGKYLFSSKCNREYTVTISADGFKSKTRKLSVGKASSNNIVTLEEIKQPEITPTEVVLNPIYFDFDKWNIRPSAAAELDRLILAMNTYPDLVIAAESHTDARGSDSYNMTLSEKRAKSMRDYIISKGIDASRISGVGKGETDLAVNCASNCSEDDHQLNRRCVFKIVK